MKDRMAVATWLLRCVVLGFTIAGCGGRDMRPPMLQRPGGIFGASPKTTTSTATSSDSYSYSSSSSSSSSSSYSSSSSSSVYPSSSSSSSLYPSSSSSSFSYIASDVLPPPSSVAQPSDQESNQGEEYDYYEDYDEYGEEGEEEEEEEVKIKIREPFFGTVNGTTTTVFLGGTAVLDCTIHDILNESVSWMRRVDDMLELLTWDNHTYAKDNRYSLVSDGGASWRRWQLVISSAQLEDQGQYRCQVATQPPKILAVNLVVTEPRVKVVDERGTKVLEKHYNSGSMIELKCVIERVPFPHSGVKWMRGSTVLTFNTSRGGISIKGDPSAGYIRSRLYVADASPADSGLYSCWYGNYTSDTVTVHVIAGENSAAMQHDAVPEETTASVSPSRCQHQLSHVLVLILSSWFTPSIHSFLTSWLHTSFTWATTVEGDMR